MAVPEEVTRLFLEELTRRGITSHPEGEGYSVEIGDTVTHVQLENIAREFERDQDPGRITRFVDTLQGGFTLPEFEEAKTRVRWSLESAESDLDDSVHQPVSEQVVMVLVYVTEDETQIAWVSPAIVEKWGRNVEDLWMLAGYNMNQLLTQSEVKFENIEEHKLGFIETEHEAFKASLLFAPGLKEVVEPVLGWPLLAVAPTRDFVYLVNQQAQDLLGNLGHVVIQEYEERGYPLSCDVYEINDEGVGTIAEFQRMPDDEPDPDGMKTIDIEGTLHFRLPADWSEEHFGHDEEEGEGDVGGIFYDPECDEATLRVFLQHYQSEEPITPEKVKSILEGSDQPNKVGPIELPDGSGLISYTSEASPGDDIVYFWQVVHPVPPNRIDVGLFALEVEAESEDDEDVRAIREMLDQQIRGCHFHSHPIDEEE